MHKQRGYKALATPRLGHVALLYDTTIAHYQPDHRLLTLNHGGWITQSTAKAINAFLTSLEPTRPYRVKRHKGHMFLVRDAGFQVIPNDGLTVGL